MEELKMTETIQQLKEDIAILQEKLQKLEEIEKHKSPVEEAYKEVYGWYPPTTPSVSNYENNRWSDFQNGYNASKVTEAAASMTNCIIEGNPPNGCSAWSEWFELFGSKGILHNLRISAKEYQPKEKEQKWGDIVRESVKWCEEHPDESVEDYLTPQTPEQVDAGLRNAMRKAKKDGVFDEPTKPMNEVLDRLENKYKDAEENAASYMTDEVVNKMLKRWETDPPSFLRFELSKTLEALITRWWDDVYDGIHQDWDREVAIDDLIDQIQLWLPKSQSSSGTQSASVIDLVDGYNDALTKIKSKLRNKK